MGCLELIVYTWPESQKCSDCRWGCFISSKMLDCSDYQCTKGCKDNDGVSCPEYESLNESGGNNDTN